MPRHVQCRSPCARASSFATRVSHLNFFNVSLFGVSAKATYWTLEPMQSIKRTLRGKSAVQLLLMTSECDLPRTDHIAPNPDPQFQPDISNPDHQNFDQVAPPGAITMSDQSEKETSINQKETGNEPQALAPELTLRSGLATAAGFTATFVSVGFLNSFGVFQDYYANVLLRGHTNFQISWIGSFSNFNLFVIGPVAGRLSDEHGPTLPMAAGALAVALAVFMISLCTQYWQLFLAQGLLLGVGLSFVMIPASSVIAKYFVRHRGAALGVSAAGSSLGGVVWPILFDQLFNHHHVSFGWSFRIAGFMMLPLLTIAVAFGRAPVREKRGAAVGGAVSAKEESGGADAAAKRARTMKVLRQPPFVFLCAGMFFFYLGFLAPIYYISTYARYLGFSPQFSLYLISILNAASFFGRTLPGVLSDRFGRFNLLALAALAAGVVGFCWSSATSVAGVVVWVSAYGFTSGAILTLQFACPTMLAPKESAGAVVGVAMSAASLACLFGAPIAGEVVEHGYLAMTCYTGSTLLAGGVFMLLSRLAQDTSIWAKL